MQHKVLGTIDFGCSEAPPSQPFSPVACALTLCQHGVLSPFSCGTWQLLMNLALPQSQSPRRNMKVFLPLSHLLSRSELKADGSLHHGAHVPRVRLNSSSRLIYLIWLLYSLVKSVVLLKHTCRRKFNCFFYAFDYRWLGICSCLDTAALTILAVVYTDWRIPARNVSHRKLKMKPRRDC